DGSPTAASDLAGLRAARRLLCKARMRTALAFLIAAAIAGCMPPGEPGPEPGSGKFAVDGGDIVVDTDGGKLPDLAPCTASEQCQSAICNAYPARGGSFCVNACTMATAAQDCPPPSPGCNKMGFCKVP